MKYNADIIYQNHQVNKQYNKIIFSTSQIMLTKNNIQIIQIENYSYKYIT
jgi:hypothetical protein